MSSPGPSDRTKRSDIQIESRGSNFVSGSSSLSSNRRADTASNSGESNIKLECVGGSNDDRPRTRPALAQFDVEDSIDQIPSQNTWAARIRRWRSPLVVMWLLLMSEAVRGIIIPTQAGYIADLGGSDTFLGVTIGLFSAGRLVMTILLGWLCTFLPYKKLFLVTSVLLIVGNLFYGAGGIHREGEWRKWLVLVGRFVLGLGAGTLSLNRAYFAEVFTYEQRTSILSAAAAVQYAGFALFPGVGSFISFVLRRAKTPSGFDGETAPAWLMAIMNLFSVLVILFLFNEPVIRPSRSRPRDSFDSSDLDVRSSRYSLSDPQGSSYSQNIGYDDKLSPDKAEDDNMLELEEEDSQEAQTVAGVPTSSKSILFVWVSFLIINFLIRVVLGTLETLGAKIYDEVVGPYHGGTHISYPIESGLFYAGLGVLGTILLILLSYFARKISDFPVFFVGLIANVLGSAILIGDLSHLGITRYIIGAACIWTIGYPLAQSIVPSLFSKIPTSTRQGVSMSWIGSAGRIVGPVIAGAIFQYSGSASTFIFNTVVAVVVLIFSVIAVIPLRRIVQG